MAIMRRSPFLDQDVSNLIARENPPSFCCAGCDEIDRLFDPDAFESSQMAMHTRL